MLWADVASIPVAKAERCNFCCICVRLACSDFAHTATVSFDGLRYGIFNTLRAAGMAVFKDILTAFPKPDFGCDVVKRYYGLTAAIFRTAEPYSDLSAGFRPYPQLPPAHLK